MLSYNVADLLRSAPGTTVRHTVDEADLPMAEGTELAAPLRGEVRLTRSGRGVLLQGSLRTALAERCSRCLGPAQAPVEVALEEEALPSVDLETGVPLDPDEEPDVLRLTDHHELDLEPPIRDAISLAEPIAPLCRPDCPGLCVICGVELAADPGHRHPDDEVDPRLAELADLRDRLD